METKSFTIESNWKKYSSFSHGWGNGYVAIPEGHLMYGMNYNDIQKNFDINIHGGLTFSELQTVKDKFFPEETIGMWIIGFDCNHFSDNKQNCPKEYVESETKRLLEQVNNPTFSKCYLDEKIRSAATDLLKACQMLLSEFKDVEMNTPITYYKVIRAAELAVKKATE